MRKVIIYPSFAIASIFVILVFLTSKTYTQLGIAVVLYLPLAYFALRVFPRNSWKTPIFTIQMPARPVQKVHKEKRERIDIADVEKRTFLKLIGAAGISFFVFSLLGRRVDTLLFGKTVDSEINSLGGITGGSSASPTEGYKISEIDDSVVSYYGFTNKNGGWLIMKEDTEGSSFRYSKGNSDFPAMWKNRESLQYDYFYNLF